MTAYIYVLAIWDRKAEEMRFEHKVILADSEDSAYTLGAREAIDSGLLPVDVYESANDYVIQLVAE